MTTAFMGSSRPRGLTGFLHDFDWSLVALLCLLGAVGVGMLYSVADGGWSPWAVNHAIRFALGLVVMMIAALINIRFWMAIAYPAWAGVMVLLIGVELFGNTAMGAQRWLDVGPMHVQPSEFMKLALVLALARYYHGLSAERASSVISLVIPAFLISAPVLLILKQPDLGTAALIILGGATVVFLAGINWKAIGLAALGAAVALPLFYQFGLHDYQRSRIFTFLNPEADPMGEGYQILQSKIALGSGGVWGKGYVQGTQAQLDFLPEKHTDFIFTMLGEEFGLIGGLFVLTLYALVAARMVMIATACRNQFSRLAVAGIAATFVAFVMINIAMVTGLAPVVGVPLPLISYGGTVILTMMAGFGIALSAHLSRGRELDKSRSLL